MKRILIITFVIVLTVSLSAHATGVYRGGQPARIGPRSTSVMLEYKTDVPTPEQVTLGNPQRSVGVSKAAQLYNTSQKTYRSYGDNGVAYSGGRLAEQSYQHIRSTQPVYNFTSTSFSITKGKLNINGHFKPNADETISPAVRKNSAFPSTPLNPYPDPIGDVPAMFMILIVLAFVGIRIYKLKNNRLLFR